MLQESFKLMWVQFTFILTSVSHTHTHTNTHTHPTHHTHTHHHNPTHTHTHISLASSVALHYISHHLSHLISPSTVCLITIPAGVKPGRQAIISTTACPSPPEPISLS